MKRLMTRQLPFLLVMLIGGFAITALPRSALADDQDLDWQFPSDLNTTITTGDTITWTWVDALPHSVTSKNGPEAFSSGVKLVGGSTFRHTFNTPGVYTYECTVHPGLMTGKITVLLPGQPTPTPVPSTPTRAAPTATRTPPSAGATAPPWASTPTPTATSTPTAIPSVGATQQRPQFTPLPPNTGGRRAAEGSGSGVPVVFALMAAAAAIFGASAAVAVARSRG